MLWDGCGQYACERYIVEKIVTCMITGIIDALIQSASDKNEEAQDAIFKSLVDIGRKKFSLVLGITHGFLLKHPKVFKLADITVINRRCVMYATCKSE